MRKRFFSTLTFSYVISTSIATTVVQDLDYSDSLEEIENPHIGFYRPVGKHFTPDGNSTSNTWGNLVHLRMDISEFSSNAVISVDKATGDTTFGVSQPLTQDMLNAFEAMLDGVRKRGKSAIVRFAYDPWYNGTKNCDPDQSLILTHLKQLGEVYSRNTDVIVFVELGMYGSWGEMHSSTNGTNANIAEALQTLLVATPPEIKIGVRRPDIVAQWLKVNDGNDYSGFDIDSDRFKQALEEKGDTIYRVGMYNDGYLGSSSDLGTVGMGASGHQMTREMMVKWLEKYSQQTPYGGELVANYNGDNPINTPEYLSVEGFRTHTSYLNYEWHQPTILGWKEIVFKNVDVNDNVDEYNGCDGYTYVANHLGYRFVLRNSTLPDSVAPNKDIPINLTIENVGFGNLTKAKKVSFVLVGENDICEIEPNNGINPRDWESEKSVNLQTSITLPNGVGMGNYQLYLRISELGNLATDNNLYCIQFGNPSSQYDSKLGANLIGNIVVSENASETTDYPAEPSCYMKGNILHVPNCDELTIHSVDGKLILIKRDLSELKNTINLSKLKENILIIRIKRKGNIEHNKIVKYLE
ncbi:MAG: DUF4832 domain-containing protein [Bacteroidales bacterium]|nr:DUF4832 domain-containing protein [Candidatus Scybalocola fimicaballi]